MATDYVDLHVTTKCLMNIACLLFMIYKLYSQSLENASACSQPLCVLCMHIVCACACVCVYVCLRL